MEADEWERTACGEIKREKHFWGEKFVSPLGLCCFFLAALAVFLPGRIGRRGMFLIIGAFSLQRQGWGTMFFTAV